MKKNLVSRFNAQKGLIEDIASRNIDLLIEGENTRAKLEL